MKRPLFTPEELAELAAFDAEMDAEPLSEAEVKASRMRDTVARLDRLSNRERGNAENQRAYYKAHKAEIAENQRAYREAHKAEIAENQRAYYGKSSSAHADQSTLRAWRKERGLRQADIAKLIGVTQGTVSMMERGVIPLNAKAMEVINAKA